MPLFMRWKIRVGSPAQSCISILVLIIDYGSIGSLDLDSQGTIKESEGQNHGTIRHYELHRTLSC